MSYAQESFTEPEQLPRFGELREVPPPEVLAMLPGAARGTSWTAERMGFEGGYPNGGLWRVVADRHDPHRPSTAIVKRTGPQHLGTSEVWRSRADPRDPQWWGREAEFYASDLASAGWTDDVRPARCHVDDHDNCRDLWLEEVASIPATPEIARRAAAGLAHWQVANDDCTHTWLAHGWIAKHIRRYGLNNEHTVNHPAWPTAMERGVDPELRDWAETRVIDPGRINAIVSELPQALTNHDFHTGNIGTVDDRVALIDWAYVGRGPIGHDAGHLAVQLAEEGLIELAEAWEMIETAYCDALKDAGWTGDQEVVRRSMAISNQLRMGWGIDHVLNNLDQIPDPVPAALSRNLLFLAHR